MNVKFNKLKNIVLKLKIKQFLITYFNSFLAFLIYFSIAVSISALLAYYFSLSLLYIKYIVIAFMLPAMVKLFLVVRSYLKSRVLSLEAISRKIEPDYPSLKDSLVNTLSLYRRIDIYKSPVAKEVIRRLLDETLSKAGKIPRGIFNFKKIFLKMGILAGLILISLLSSTKFDSYGQGLNMVKSSFFWDSQNYIEVEPGNSSVAPGSDLKVKVKTNMSKPTIQINRLDETSVKKMSREEQGRYLSTLYDIDENLTYRIKTAEGYRSDSYEVRILNLPAIKSLKAKLNYPDYTGKPDFQTDGGNMRALKGTIAELNLKTDSPLKKAVVIVEDEKREMEKKDKKNFSTKIMFDRDKEYRIILTGQNGMVNSDLPLYRVEALNDSAPEVTLIYPDRDLKVSPDAKVELRGNAKDNLGIKSIYIKYFMDVGGKQISVPVKTFEKPQKEVNFSYIWDIAETEALPGSMITYNVTVYDSNTLYGPSENSSRNLHLEIEGFRERHKEILKDMEKAESELLNMLEQSYDLSDKIDENNFSEAEKELEDLKKKLADSIRNFEDISDRMEKDSFTEESTRRELKGLNRVMKNILNKNISDAESSINSKDQKAASEDSRKIEKELEKAAKLTGELTKRERMSDINSSAEDSLNSARELKDMLSEENPAPEDIVKGLQKLASLLNEMQKSIKNMPQNLPQEFINKESIQDLDFNTPKNSMEKLMEAIKNGDYEKARELLKNLTDSLQKIAESIQKSAGDSYSSRNDTLSKRTNQMENKLKEIIEKQKDILQKTEIEEDYMDTVKIKRDREKFNNLKERFKEFKSTTGFRSRDADREFARGRLFKTPDIIENYLKSQKDTFKKKKAEEILEFIRSRPDYSKNLNSDKKDTLKKLSVSERNLKSETENIRNGLDTLSHMSALFDPEIYENISSAIVFMGKASNELESFMVSDAVGSQRRVLAYLNMTKNKMQKFSQQMKSMPQKLNSGTSGIYRQYQSGGAGGRRGFEEGYVEIPSAADARSGEEIRKKILEALKEKYPQRYQKIIREYFKSLSE